MTAKPDTKSLLQRVDSGVIPGALQSLVSGIRTLQRGEHDVNGRKGEACGRFRPTAAFAPTSFIGKRKVNICSH